MIDRERSGLPEDDRQFDTCDSINRRAKLWDVRTIKISIFAKIAQRLRKCEINEKFRGFVPKNFEDIDSER